MKKQFVGWIISKTQNQLLPTSHLSRLEILVLGYYKCTDSPIPHWENSFGFKILHACNFFLQAKIEINHFD
jgi:hypothetical protein